MKRFCLLFSVVIAFGLVIGCTSKFQQYKSAGEKISHDGMDRAEALRIAGNVGKNLGYRPTARENPGPQSFGFIKLKKEDTIVGGGDVSIRIMVTGQQDSQLKVESRVAGSFPKGPVAKQAGVETNPTDYAQKHRDEYVTALKEKL